MNATRLSDRNHWIGVGRRAKVLGYQLEKILTGKETVDALIEKGYRLQTAKAVKK